MITEEMHAALRRPFPVGEVEWRLQSAKLIDGKVRGMCLAYITAREVMDRLDMVFGASGWSSSLSPIMLGGKDTGIICTITAGGVSHSDVSDLTDVEPLKGGASTALKRAAVHYGIGRYLYDLPNCYIEEDPKGSYRGEVKDGGTGGQSKRFNWNPPSLPPYAVPDAVDVRVGERFVAVPLDFAIKAKAMAPDKCKEQYLKIVSKLPEGFDSLPWSDRLDPMGKIRRLIDLRARIVLWEDDNNRTIEL